MIRFISIFTLYMCFISNNAMVRAADTIFLKEKIAHLHPSIAEWDDIPTVSEMIAPIYNCLQSGIAPEEISVILDVDGTLTNQSDPTYLKAEDTILERGAAIKFVRWLIRQKINIVFASAWHKIVEEDPLAGFKETLGRLEKLGFKNLLTEKATIRNEEWEEKRLSVMAAGHAVSVKDIQMTFVAGSLRKDIYYRQKAYALYYYDQEVAAKTKTIFFADDSRGNTQRFKLDILDSWSSLYPKLQEIYIYTLTDRLTETDSWHQVLNLIEEIGDGEAIDPFSVSLLVGEGAGMRKKDVDFYQGDPYSLSAEVDCSVSLRKSTGVLRSSVEDNLQQTLSPRRVLISSQ